MRRKRIKTACLLLAAALPLAACGGERADGGEALSATAYVPEFYAMPTGMANVWSCAVSGGYLYLLGSSDSVENGVDAAGESYELRRTAYGIARQSLDGGPTQVLDAYRTWEPEEEGQSANLHTVALIPGGDGTVWAREQGVLVLEAEKESRDIHLLRQLDDDGGEIRRIDLSALEERLGVVREPASYYTQSESGYLVADNEPAVDMAFDGEGNFYYLTTDRLYVLDGELEPLFDLSWEGVESEENDPGGLVTLGDGVVALERFTREESAYARCRLRPIDTAGKSWGEEQILPAGVIEAYGGGGEWRFLTRSGTGLAGWRTGEEEGTELASWSEIGIAPSRAAMCAALDDGRLLVVELDGGTPEAAFLTETDRASLPEVTTLTYAALSAENVNWEAVNRFNRSHSDVRIRVKDYSVYTSGAWYDNSGRERLALDIAAGKMPDILDMGANDSTGRLPLEQMVHKGLLEDLWQWIERDPDLGREAVMEEALRAAEVDGGLYFLFRKFSIRTAVGQAGLVGDRWGWTPAEAEAVLASLPEGATVAGRTISRDDLLGYVLPGNLDRFVDWDAGTCAFESEEFQSLLEFCAAAPAQDAALEADTLEVIAEDLAAGRQMVLDYTVSNFDELQLLDVLLGGEAAWVGWPRAGGACGSAIFTGPPVAITTACQDKEAAWAFIRELILPVNPSGADYWMGFPVNRGDFERLAQAAMSDARGKTTFVFGGVEAEIRPMSREKYGEFLEFLGDIDTLSRYDEALYDTVTELAGAYFAGDRSLEDTCRLIQSRAEIYVNENR